MSNHPHRSRQNPGPRSPTKEELIAARERTGLTPADAAKLVHSTTKSWERWEAGERPMHPAMFELFSAKTPGALHVGLDLAASHDWTVITGPPSEGGPTCARCGDARKAARVFVLTMVGVAGIRATLCDGCSLIVWDRASLGLMQCINDGV